MTIQTWKRGDQLTCGCCAGPEEDRCCCHIHQDIPRGLRAHKCSLHSDAQQHNERSRRQLERDQVTAGLVS